MLRPRVQHALERLILIPQSVNLCRSLVHPPKYGVVVVALVVFIVPADLHAILQIVIAHLVSPFSRGYFARSTSNSFDAVSAAAFGSVSVTSTSICTSPFAFRESDTLESGSLRRVARASATSETVGCGRRSVIVAYLAQHAPVRVRHDQGGGCGGVARHERGQVFQPVSDRVQLVAQLAVVRPELADIKCKRSIGA